MAFFRTEDPSTGEIEDVVVIKVYGETPSMDDLLSSYDFSARR